MREPYETILGPFRDTIEFAGFLRPYLQDDEPDWGGIANDPRLDALSTGEKVLLDFCAAYANLGRHLDIENQLRCTLALSAALGVR